MEDWRVRSPSFADMAVMGSVNWNLTLQESARSETLSISAVSAGFLSVVGTSPLIGRDLAPSDEQGAIPGVMVISHGLWIRRFGGDPDTVGSTVSVKLDAEGPAVPVEVVGVMPRAFDFPRGTDAWVPAAPLVRKYSEAFGGPGAAMERLQVFYVLGRLRHDVSLDDAGRELTQVMRTADTKGAPEPYAELVLTPVATHLLGAAGPVLWTLLAGSVLMLAIACANVAGLQVSRSTRRQRELAIRAAIGASNRQLLRSAALESLLVTAFALAGGAVIAAGIARGLVRIAPVGVPRLDAVELLDPRVLLAGGIAAFLTVLLCGLWPALVAGRVEAAGVLAHGTGATVDPGGRRILRGVVVAQIGIALTLLAGTALFVRTVNGLERTALGFDPNGVLAIPIRPATDDLARWNAYYEALIERLEALAGVATAGAVAVRPLSGPIGWDSQPLLPGQVPAEPATWALNPHTNLEVVTPGYFRAMGIRLVRGRLFTLADTATSPGVVVVSETTARRLWPDRDALGQRLRDPTYRSTPSASDDAWQTVIGVVEDVRYRGLNDVRLDLYLPATQSTNRVQTLMVRTRGNPADVVASIQAAARGIDPNVQASDAAIMSEVVAAESAPWRFLVRVFLSFAAAAAVLSVVGLGAVIALAVAIRRRELAIRAALGASPAQLRTIMLREGVLLVAGGIVLGLTVAFALGRGVAHLLVGIAPHDPVALGAAAIASAAAGVLAIAIPARRAAEADPLEALRAE